MKNQYVKSFQDIKEGYLRNDVNEDNNDDDDEDNFETDQVEVSIKPISTNSMDPRKMFEKIEKQNEKIELTMNFDGDKGSDDEQKKPENPLKNITSKKDLNKIVSN